MSELLHRKIITLGLLIVGAVLVYVLFSNSKLFPISQNEEATANVLMSNGNEEFIDTSKYSFIMPVRPGTKWIYEGKRIFYNTDRGEVQEIIGQKTVEIKRVEKEDDKLRVFTHVYYKNDPDFNESNDSFLISESGYGFNSSNMAYFPLINGQRLTADYPERTDGYYDYWVAAVSLKNILGKQHKCYDISYRGLPDESLDVFCEGVGYVQDSYKHHGTPNEWDYRLIRIEYPALKD